MPSSESQRARSRRTGEDLRGDTGLRGGVALVSGGEEALAVGEAGESGRKVPEGSRASAKRAEARKDSAAAVLAEAVRPWLW